jgi:putative oligomerization/nucleic acid binding protein
MKKAVLVLTVCCTLLTTLLTSGCVAAIGNRNPGVTVGQQLIDLQKAKDSGAITEAEFQREKARLLGTK